MQDLERISSSLSFLYGAEMRDVDSNELSKDALKLAEDEDNDCDAGSVAFVALRSSVFIFEYSSVLILTFKDDRIPFKDSVDAIPLPLLILLVWVELSVVDVPNALLLLAPLLDDKLLLPADVIVNSAESMGLLPDDDSGDDEAMPYALASELTASAPRATVST